MTNRYNNHLSPLYSHALSLIRRGPREIVWTPPEARLGNFLYLWLHAFIEQKRGNDSLVLETPEMMRWRDEFPYVFKTLVISRNEVRFNDRRLVAGPLQQYGNDFTREQLDSFIDCAVKPAGTPFAGRIEAELDQFDLTINIRRGDYYSVPRWRGEYSFDIVEYIRTVTSEIRRQRPIESIHIVSDDLEWCRIKLRWLSDLAIVTEPKPHTHVCQQLAMLAGSRRLILTNSTFSYWGGYLSENIGRHGETQREIWAPWFHNRYAPDGGKAVQLSDTWNVVASIPGGWDG